MFIELNKEQRQQIKEKKKFNSLLAHVVASPNKGEFFVRSKNSSKTYCVYWYTMKQRYLCECIHFALKGDEECWHIRIVKKYRRFF